MKEIIAAKTAGDTSQKVQVTQARYVSIAQSGLAGVEVITFDIDLDGTWTAVMPAMQLTAATNLIQLAGPATYRINKPVTAGNCAVFMEE